MDIDRPPKLRTPGSESGAATPPGGAGIGGPPPPINALAELVADLIAATGLVPADKLAMVRSAAGMGSFAHALVEQNVASSEGLARTLAARYQMPLVDLPLVGVSDEAGSAIPLHVLERLVAMPYALEDGTLRIAVADPGNIQGIDELRLATRYPLEIGVAARDDILVEIRRLTRASEAFGARAAIEEELAEEEEEETDDLEVEDGISDAPLVRLVNSVIFQAAEDGASDVHFEPQEDCLLVRFRVDGVLHEVQRIPKRMMPGVLTRMKVLAKLDIAERRKPQDGRISLNAAAAGRTLDVRVATLPTVEGESVVMRLLDKSKKAPTLQELGMSDEMRAALEVLIRKPTGALLVTGPTGSGKSTTLYAALTEINRPEINIITVEDPVEYRLGGVNQVQINQKAGLTFATALRSILRSDPDVVMVGEIRDGETAKISIEAALTGHLVLSTLHTNDAPQALTRLGEMGVEPFLIGAAVSAVLAQRLARKLCTHCCEMYQPSVDELMKARVSRDVAAASDGMVFYRKKGCPRCNQTGYKGRIGVYQLLTMSEQLESLAVTKASREDIERAAIGEGMRTLWDDGLAKVAAGLTSIEELARVSI
ncbi:MAG: type pilus assembly protein PilB [Gaiellaceae bacterium]|jgi:type IV pilus assembly protein PilB|nr:type pilus assembly protein PilB [Gaiellaceae bacterium]